MKTTMLVVLVVLSGCGGDEGEAPAISNLTFSPGMLPVAMQTAVSGTMDFSDPDGDLAELGVEIALPNGMKQSLPMQELQGVGERTSGQLVWAMAVNPPSQGAYPFELWVTDSAGRESNHLSGSLDSQ